ncbi:TolB protein [Mariprofundus micogutta]|uniref:TolB protein n=1 Tax=Mariprofundus micogutta TaxID=1921010 RepID=A0A1L8CPX4_9PROT|nr:Tol-Pal system beta propeller repeat protein TolB [Mariprofundus micogutta]GAV20934.1 TolB protein [Mariprofundus micogutta]
MRFTVILFISLFASFLSHAAEFDIYQSTYKPLKVAIVLEAGQAAGHKQSMVYGVIKNDLTSSQSFAAIDPMAFLASFQESWEKVEYGDWRIIGADIVALCNFSETDKGWRAEIKVHDPFRAKLLTSVVVESSTAALRTLSHRVADQIYSAALGIPGYFTSHILYVQKRGEYSDLVYMDQDGANNQPVGKNFTLLLSPDWSPDGRQVALNTYVGNHPRLEFFDLRTGARNAFGNFKGLNSTPEFSHDGRYVAATLSHSGNTDIHIYDIKNATWSRFTNHKGIDTTPTWSPDGKWIAFVSNRSGQPQVYRKKVSGGRAQLVSTQGSYNTSPVWSPMGDRIAMISLKNWSYAVATVRPDGQDIRYLATGERVESPSWSPNGQMLLYSAEKHRVRRVYRVPSWGGREEPITPPNIDASDAAWSRH